MKECPHCSNAKLDIVEEGKGSGLISATFACMLCGWTRTEIDMVPTEDHVSRAIQLRELSLYMVVDAKQERINEYDFTSIEEAEAVAEVLNGSVLCWSVGSEDWDGETQPNIHDVVVGGSK